MPDKGGTAPRITIKFGAPSSSRASPSSTLGKRARPQLLHADSDSDHDNNELPARHEPIASLTSASDLSHDDRRADRGGEGPPRVIPKQPNRDWKSERGPRAKRASQGLADPRRITKNAAIPEPDDQVPLKWGLTLKPKDAAPLRTPPTPLAATPEQNTMVSEDRLATKSRASAQEGPSETVDDEAMDALLGKLPVSSGKELVIPSEASQVTAESDVFRRQLLDAPEGSTLKDYEEMPVEEFGAALLRGMGWDGKPRGPKPKSADVKRRPNHMGLGAKSLNSQEDLGSWNQRKSAKPSFKGSAQK